MQSEKSSRRTHLSLRTDGIEAAVDGMHAAAIACISECETARTTALALSPKQSAFNADALGSQRLAQDKSDDDDDEVAGDADKNEIVERDREIRDWV